jgi:hypothetical protein
MANNTHFYGFRWAVNFNGKPQPMPLEMAVASAANFTVSGNATNLNLNVGDPVKINTDGTVSVSGGNENSQTSQTTWGIVVGMGGQGYYNGTRMVRAPFLPSGVTYGTNVDRQSKVLVVPCSAGVWEIDVDDNTTATTYLGYQALIGENADHQNYPNAQGHVNADLMVNPLLNIASHNPATTTLAWRIVGISQNLANQDFSGTFVKLLVSVNKGAEPFYTATGT